MSQQPFSPQQTTCPFLIQIQRPEDESVSHPEPGYRYHINQYGWTPQPAPSHTAVDPTVAHHYPAQYANPNLTGAIHYSPPLTGYPQYAVIPPPSSSPIPIPSLRPPTAELSPFSSPGSPGPITPGSTSSSPGGPNPDVCRQSQPVLNEETKQWSCSGCSRSFSDKYGAERHIATVGLKVKCRYCGSRVSALDYSRRRHLRRESCQKQAADNGFLIRNEEDAFIEEP